jgi:hypothetical protein
MKVTGFRMNFTEAYIEGQDKSSEEQCVKISLTASFAKCQLFCCNISSKTLTAAEEIKCNLYLKSFIIVFKSNTNRYLDR